MTQYFLRQATIDDVAFITRQRHAMFAEMGEVGNYAEANRRFSTWLQQAMRNQLYFGWFFETAQGDIAAGGGVMLAPTPPSPMDMNEYRGYVQNIYTEPAHRHQGLARKIVETIHQWCREQNLQTMVLHTSQFGRPMYEKLGYEDSTEMQLTLENPTHAISNV
jgi:GNAT superfamily N-acetyltransferase